METETTTEATETTCTACMTIPISHLQLEIEMPISGSWQPIFDELEIRVLTDTAGRPAITNLAARKLFAAFKRQDEIAAERSDLRVKKLAAKHPVPVGAGLPMVEGATPFESMVAAGGVVSPQAEFGSGRERPNFLREELAAGQRADDEKKRLATERAKQRLADQMKDRLGGKR